FPGDHTWVWHPDPAESLPKAAFNVYRQWEAPEPKDAAAAFPYRPRFPFAGPHWAGPGVDAFADIVAAFVRQVLSREVSAPTGLRFATGAGGRPVLQVRPPHLRAALFLQFAVAFAEDKDHRRCKAPGCG